MIKEKRNYKLIINGDPLYLYSMDEVKRILRIHKYAIKEVYRFDYGTGEWKQLTYKKIPRLEPTARW